VREKDRVAKAFLNGRGVKIMEPANAHSDGRDFRDGRNDMPPAITDVPDVPGVSATPESLF
jgi:hypothetical protein